MEMRACWETGMSRDLTQPIPPFAASLYDSFLLSHCSSCFLPLPALHAASYDPIDGGHCPDAPSPPCCCDGAAPRYCSRDCRDADLDIHSSSGECHLLRLVRLHHPELSAWLGDETTDLRAAVRLMHSFEKLGFLPFPGTGSGRIGGLLVGNREELEEGCELSVRIKEGGALMSRARKLFRGGVRDGCDGGDGGTRAEEAVLWLVVTNAVEVQVGEGRALGIAVYGPWFSWFNHSCSPNACYRFELFGSECFLSAKSGFLVYPMATGPEDDMALRRSDLCAKYGFICCCRRCSANPEMYVDRILRGEEKMAEPVTRNSEVRRQSDRES